jgi:hypothetical protein
MALLAPQSPATATAASWLLPLREQNHEAHRYHIRFADGLCLGVGLRGRSTRLLAPSWLLLIFSVSWVASAALPSSSKVKSCDRAIKVCESTGLKHRSRRRDDVSNYQYALLNWLPWRLHHYMVWCGFLPIMAVSVIIGLKGLLKEWI